MAEYTFDASFTEFLPEYRDVTRVWIGDGVHTGTYGMLYAQYVNNEIAELGYVTLYNIAAEEGYEGSATDWADAIVDLAAMDKGATVTVSYQNSSSGVNPPSNANAWTSSPTPTKGQYLWTRIKLKWKKRTLEDTIYTVSYQGADGDVRSVNGSVGAVTIHGSNTPISGSSDETIKHYIDNMTFTPEIATNAQIDALFA
jgi:hypothetical protein